MKIICKNCNHKPKISYIKAMLKAGFALWHLACEECGQHTLSDATKQ